ncbi:Hypothetical protein SMAX5B_022549 [Scophthalmus maximus]|uniref:Uncharacterized protein n=1 Tax=Scophthalmus maximus TaxID=52904 RepID=A0A2U9C2I1_SCOMX|nr:Hypothetical protein SMAX5B_022549 [Scophthalmus maximus]KAF0042032.1 hypothetical protein F2P81_005564 [Scophthalmus maximus]
MQRHPNRNLIRYQKLKKPPHDSPRVHVSPFRSAAVIFELHACEANDEFSVNVLPNGGNRTYNARGSSGENVDTCRAVDCSVPPGSWLFYYYSDDH